MLEVLSFNYNDFVRTKGAFMMNWFKCILISELFTLNSLTRNNSSNNASLDNKLDMPDFYIHRY